MTQIDDFWDDLMGHIRQRVLVTIVGPEATVADVDGIERTLTSLIGERLVERYGLRSAGTTATMGSSVAAFLRERGRDEAERLYRVINDIIADLDPTPGGALQELAAITDLRLFLSTTPDRLLAQAINAARFRGATRTREIAFAPTQSTVEQSRNMDTISDADTVVMSLFGKAASTPQYAIHEEDRLEWLHAILSDAASLPSWLGHQLKHQPVLFVGCEIPDWLGRFLVRMSSNSRLSLDSKQYFFVGSAGSYEPSLASFFQTFCRRTQIQHLDMAPGEFVTELRRRWLHGRPAPREQRSAILGAEDQDRSGIFISYMREDVAAARRLRDAIAEIGGGVWMDERRLRPGDNWEREILREIRRTVRLFIPVVSINTERADEGYYFREWMEAVERSRSIPRRRFVIPVVVDEDYDGNPGGYRQIPEEFERFHFGHAPRGQPDANLITMITAEIRAMRRSGAA